MICVYNAGAYLRPSVESIVAQTYRELEILIIDDGSTDGCIETIRDLIDADPRIRLLRQANAGKPAALNRALDELRGAFWAVHDADDISHPRRIERQLAALLADESLGAVFSGYQLIVGDRALAPTFAARSPAQCAADVAAFRMPAHDATAMFRTACTRGLRYDPALTLGEGRDFILQVGERHGLRVLGECLYDYRIHGGSITVREQQRRAHFDAEVIRRACRRRGLTPPEPAPDAANAGDKQRMLVSHFMESVVNQREAGAYLAALRTAVQCAVLRPLRPHSYCPLAYALAPLGLIRRHRARRQRPVEAAAPAGAAQPPPCRTAS